MAHELDRANHRFSDRPELLDLGIAHGFIASTYWAKGIPRDLFERSVRHSMPFGVYDLGAGNRQIGFARVLTDRATFAYLADVFIQETSRGKGLATILVQHILAHPDLQGLRRVALLTRDAQPLYERLGFTYLGEPRMFMELRQHRGYAAKPC